MQLTLLLTSKTNTMKLNKLHIAILFLLCGAAASCNRVEQPVTDLQKSPIVLSVGGVDSNVGTTKAVVTDGTTNTTFGRDTKVFILMKSDKEVDGEGNVVVHNGFEYKGPRLSPLYTVSRGDIEHATNPTALVFDSVNQKYWDDAHARSSQLSMWAVAQKVSQPGVDGTWKTITFQKIHGSDPMSDANTRDSYNTTVRNEFQSDKTVYPVIYTWNVGNPAQDQNVHTLVYQDLMFSNNLADYTGEEWDDEHKNIPGGSRTDNRLKFDFTNRKFPETSEMKFYHAMSKITIQLKAGDGFKADGNDFVLKNNTVDLIHGVNTCGLFNIKDGEFQQIHAAADIHSIPLTKTVVGKSEPYYTLEALAIPNIHKFMVSQRTGERPNLKDDNSRFVDGDNTVMLEITVDNNKYKITSDDLFDAINGKANATTLTDNGTYVPLEAGKNYVFTFIIGKQRIEHLTAQVAEWETVTAEEQTPTNARIQLDLEERGSAVSSDAKFYKANDNKTTEGIDDNYEVYNWKTGYTDLSATYSSSHWTTSYFWESSKDFYHFRALMPSSSAVVTDSEGGDYVDLSSASSYTDVRWGAPMKDDGNNETPGSFKWKYGPTKNGFDADDSGNVASGLPGGTTHQIYKAIGPTKNPVKLILFHMMSDLTIKIKTTTEADAVTLVSGDDKTVVQLVNYKANGRVLMGNGLVKATSDPATVGIAHNSVDGSYQVYKFGAVPQDLENVELHITTPDHNLYKVSLASVKATAITTTNIENPYSVTDGKYILNRWYPAFQYTYSFTLRKSGIKNLEATVVPWEAVEAEGEDVYIQ